MFRSFREFPVDDAEPMVGSLDSSPAFTGQIGRLSMEGLLSRTFDLVVATLALLVALPLMLAIVLALLLFDRGPIFFRHQRIGQHGKRFECMKFRTMRVDGDRVLAEHLARDPAARHEWETTQKLRSDPRVTVIGRFLRGTSLDELPQLFNVFVGEMAIVGPRPVVLAELRHYRRYADHYMTVRPGITGLWQVSGRNATSYRRRVACDVKYVRSRSISGDIGIIFRTVPAVLVARGAY